MRLLFLLLALGIGAPALRAASPDGGALFRQVCATCHGLSARGDGPMASVISIPMPDLTLIAARNGGTFPMAQVVAVIDGRTALVAHGGPMPIFGFSLGGEGVVLSDGAGGEVRTGAEIAAIAAWLETVQR